MKKLLLILLFISSFSFSQTASGDLEAYLNNYIDNIPGDSGNNYTNPNNVDLPSWEQIIENILNGNINNARGSADNFNYQIVEYTNTASSDQDVYYILEEKAQKSNYWGTFVFAKNTNRGNLILQAPHSKFDFNTGKQAIYCFVRLNNKALFLNGTHRCNNSTASSCSGTTSVCTGSSDPFKISDMAHNSESVWQKTTEVLKNTIAGSVFVQLHGFSKQASDPYVILSNGTDLTPSLDNIAELKNQLSVQDNSLTFKIAHIDNWTRLVGFTNTQGRLINESANPCSTSASTTDGRFIHIEQEKSKLREDSSGWEKMHQALAHTFPKILSVKEQVKVTFKTKNPFTNSISFTTDNMKSYTIFNVLGKQILHKNTTSNNITILTNHFKNGMYFLRIKTDKGSVFKKLIRE